MTAGGSGSHEQRFEMAPRSELSVSNVSGKIAVRGGEGCEIVVRYEKHGSSRSRENTQVDIHKDGNRVTVQTRSGPIGLINFGRSSPVEYDIEVPSDCSIRLNAVSADVDVQALRAGAGIQSVSGDVRITDVAGDMTITTVSGDIVAGDLVGTMVARTTSGDAKMHSSRLRRFSVSTVSGDFVIETPLIPDEQCNAKTVSGDLHLLLPPDTGATIQLKSISGTVSCELPAEIIKAGRRHWQGRVNGGGGHVEMNSVSGDLRIGRAGRHAARRDDDATRPYAGTDWMPASPTLPEPPVLASSEPAVRSQQNDEPASEAGTQDSRSERVPSEDDPTVSVLAALERGEISVEEAMTRLA